MEKKLYLFTAIVLAIALCAVPMFAFATDSFENNESNESIKLSDFADNQSLSDLSSVYSKAKLISEGSKNVVIDNNAFTNSFFRCAWQAQAEQAQVQSDVNYTISDDITLKLASSNVSENDVYGIFLGLLTECCTDYAAYDDYVAMEHIMDLNRPAATFIVFCNDYQTLGYDNINDYLVAVENGECEYTENTYRVYFQEKRVTRMNDTTDTDIYPEIAKKTK